ncbi:MAG: DinB family protein [Bryobacteraceae bacterium]|nr:DinB family protein [Bryobacteraceae bacterium]
MKRVCGMLLTLTTVAALGAGELDQADRKVLLDHLNRSSSEFLESVNGLTKEQWNYKPAADVWSVAECAGHIALSEDFLRDIIEKKILSAPASTERVAERKALDEKVVKMVTDRSFKAKAPEPLIPSGQFATPDEIIAAFQRSREKTIAFAKSRDDLREHAAPHPVLKEMDAYQWLLFLSGHTMRHTAQIQEVKANAGFPRGK